MIRNQNRGSRGFSRVDKGYGFGVLERIIDNDIPNNFAEGTNFISLINFAKNSSTTIKNREKPRKREFYLIVYHGNDKE